MTDSLRSRLEQLGRIEADLDTSHFVNIGFNKLISDATSEVVATHKTKKSK